MTNTKQQQKETLGITKEQFAVYEQCRKSGQTNMFDVRTVELLTDLDSKTIVTIMKNYKILKQTYGVQEEQEKI